MDQRAFAAFLTENGLISAKTLAKALEYQSVMSGRLDTVLLGMGAMNESRMLKTLGTFFKARTVSGVELATVDPVVARILSPRVARRFRVAPFRKEGNRLSIASMVPLDLLVEDELALLTGCMVNSFVALEIRMLEFLARHAQQDLPLQMLSVLKILRGQSTGPHARPTTAAAQAAPHQAARPPREERPGTSADGASTAAEAGAVTEEPPAEEALRPRQPEPTELEIDDEDLELFPSLRNAAAPPATPPPLPPPLPRTDAPPQPAAMSPVAKELSPEERLVAAADEMQDAEMRDDIGDAMLAFCAPYLARRMLLVLRKGAIVGWRGEGEGVDEIAVRAISIPVDEPSVFVGLTQGTSFWLGGLPPMARNLDLVLGLGGDRPKDCVILPVSVKSKIVCFLYGDNLDRGVAGVPMALLRRLIAKASLAFQVYLLKSKIRLM